MQLIVAGVVILSAVYLGYLMGKGEKLELRISDKLKFAVRTEAQEKELEEKLNRKVGFRG